MFAIIPQSTMSTAGTHFEPRRNPQSKCKATPPKLKPCPFCKKSDRLSLIHWIHERANGAEFNGDAVKCDRCDAIAPLAVFQGRIEASR